MIKAGIIGSTGYAGQELVRLLMQHKDAEIVWYGSRSYIDQKYYEVFHNMFEIVDADCMDDNMDELAEKADVIFTATPQGLCSSLVSEEVLSKTKIIDLSADFRIKDADRYEEWYGIRHPSREFIKEAVYGLCEINREDVKKARLIANPGCYPTCSILSIYPPSSSMPSPEPPGREGAQRSTTCTVKSMKTSKPMEWHPTGTRRRSRISSAMRADSRWY